MKKIGFVGCGNMAKAMLKQMLASGIVSKEDVIVSALHEESRKALQESFQVSVTDDNTYVATEATYIFVATKPQVYPQVMKEIADMVTEDKVIITVAPGKTVLWTKEQFGKELKVIRTMPNTPAMVAEGITGYCCIHLVTD